MHGTGNVGSETREIQEEPRPQTCFASFRGRGGDATSSPCWRKFTLCLAVPRRTFPLPQMANDELRRAKMLNVSTISLDGTNRNAIWILKRGSLGMWMACLTCVWRIQSSLESGERLGQPLRHWLPRLDRELGPLYVQLYRYHRLHAIVDQPICGGISLFTYIHWYRRLALHQGQKSAYLENITALSSY